MLIFYSSIKRLAIHNSELIFSHPSFDFDQYYQAAISWKRASVKMSLKSLSPLFLWETPNATARKSGQYKHAISSRNGWIQPFLPNRPRQNSKRPRILHHFFHPTDSSLLSLISHPFHILVFFPYFSISNYSKLFHLICPWSNTITQWSTLFCLLKALYTRKRETRFRKRFSCYEDIQVLSLKCVVNSL